MTEKEKIKNIQCFLTDKYFGKYANEFMEEARGEQPLNHISREYREILADEIALYLSLNIRRDIEKFLEDK